MYMHLVRENADLRAADPRGGHPQKDSFDCEGTWASLLRVTVKC